MSEKRKLIETISISRGNLEYIADNGVINGTLLVEIERVMGEYTNQLQRDHENEYRILRKEWDKVREEKAAIFKEREAREKIITLLENQIKILKRTPTFKG